MLSPNKSLDRRRSAGAAAGAARGAVCSAQCRACVSAPLLRLSASRRPASCACPPRHPDRCHKRQSKPPPVSDCRPDSRRLSGSPARRPILLACGSRCTGLGTAPASGLAGRRTCGAPPLPPSYRHACSPHPAPKCLEPQARVLPLGPPARGTEALSPGGPRSLRHARGGNRRS